MPTSPAELAPLARRTGYEGNGAAERLLAELEQHRSRIRATFERCFTAEQRREQ